MSLARPRAAAPRLILAAYLLLSCERSPAAAPAATATSGPAAVTAQPAPPEPSLISIAVRASLADVAALVEPKVPRTFTGRSQERGFAIRYEIERRPLALQIIGRGLHTRTKIFYGIEACTRAFPCISCGMSQTRRQADIALHSVLTWGADWRLHSSTRPLPTSYPVRCEITPLRLDITDQFIAPVVADQLRLAASEIDRNIPPSTNLRPDAQRIWTSLRTPVEIAPRTWLVLEPDDVALSPISGSGTEITSILTLRAMTRVAIGERPVTTPRPLPPLRNAAPPAGGLRVPLHIDLPWSEAGRILTSQLVGPPMKTGSGVLTVQSLTMTALPPQRVRIEARIDYRAGLLRSYRGTIVFSGTPHLSPSGDALVMPDLDYILGDDAGFFARTADRIAHDSLRARLRQSFRIDLAPQLNLIRANIARGLTRSLGPGASMRGIVDDLRITRLTTKDTGFEIGLLAIGSAEVRLATLK